MQKRLYIERQPGYQIESQTLIHEIKHVLNIDVDKLRYVVLYEIKGMSDCDIEQTLYTVFAEKNKDDVYFDLEIKHQMIAYEYLPGQYDQRADSALQCVHLIVDRPDIIIKTGTLIIFEQEIQVEHLNKIKSFLINRVESREKDMKVMEWPKGDLPEPVFVIEGFVDFHKDEINLLHQSEGLAMNIEDLLFIQSYFQKEMRNPTMTEIKILDTYWSDHCRHTTFETMLEDIHFTDQAHQTLQEAYQTYIDMRKTLKREHLPVTLMDLATINMRYEMMMGRLNDIEVSEEHNAASIIIDVDIDGKNEPWLLMFKNETHNHPTEIEPFGGASTCIGGAIRDPLSGRSYVYSATRITGAGDITEPIEKTMHGKLPQRVISKKAAEGYSSYGNQIGLATTFVQEIYHEGYKAKRMEVGAVIGAAPLAHIKRDTPKPGDLILLIGGRTGRDGMGGATGSSKSHQTTSIQSSAAEVQKGNAVIERKIQRLFRNVEVTRYIKKSNDFGAGGICVAMGELAHGVYIELDKIPVKYQGLNATELAISESQERMAIVIDPKSEMKIKAACYAENLEVTTVAKVTQDSRLVMTFHGQVVCDIAREFIETSGVRSRQKVEILPDSWSQIFKKSYQGETLKDKSFEMLTDLNIASQQGMVEMFDSTIGTSTVIMPFGGKHQKTKAQASIQRLPVINKKTKAVSIMTHGFDPYISEQNPFLGASYAIIDSMAKTVASGGLYTSIRFTFQEYFERLGHQPEIWGKPFKALLGACTTLKAFNLAAIGGKDSMSGSFEQIHVPPTLISFAVSKGNLDNMIANAFVAPKSYLYLAKHTPDAYGRPNIDQLKVMYTLIHQYIQSKTIISAYALSFGGLMEALIKGTFGNMIGIEVNTKLDLFQKDYGSILIESQSILKDPSLIYLGRTAPHEVIQINEMKVTILEALTQNELRFKEIYPLIHQDDRTIDHVLSTINLEQDDQPQLKKSVYVLLPIFPGTNCEYDSERAFVDAGATVETFVFNNLTQDDINISIHQFAHQLDQTDILMLSGGFSSGDEPDGSGKFIANVLRHPLVLQAITRLRNRKGLILGICNGFQALIKSGLLPYGKIVETKKDDPNLHKNLIHRHVSKLSLTKIVSSHSPWLKGMEGQVHLVPISHGEGRLVISEPDLNQLIEQNQIAFQYVNLNGLPSYDPTSNPNGSTYAIEGLISADGLILGKMGHSERIDTELYKNIPNIKKQTIFDNAVKYIKQRGA